jgi:hypothetical protein
MLKTERTDKIAISLETTKQNKFQIITNAVGQANYGSVIFIMTYYLAYTDRE